MRNSWLDGLLCREDCAIIMKEKTSETKNMKIVVLGGTGLIGSKVVNLLRARGHEVVAASPSQGINSITGEGFDSGTDRSAGGRGRHEFSFVRRQGRPGILRNFDPQRPRC